VIHRCHAGGPVDLISGIGVPTVHRFGPYRFYFFAHENQETGEPPHIHVLSGDGEAEFWLEPVSLKNSWGYTPREHEFFDTAP